VLLLLGAAAPVVLLLLISPLLVVSVCILPQAWTLPAALNLAGFFDVSHGVTFE
jgi:hypothetical protein